MHRTVFQVVQRFFAVFSLNTSSDLFHVYRGFGENSYHFGSCFRWCCRGGTFFLLFIFFFIVLLAFFFVLFITCAFFLSTFLILGCQVNFFFPIFTVVISLHSSIL
eukprot:PhF_6_TR22223/c0_g1_i1/m.31382